jgi:hypothetical protein
MTISQVGIRLKSVSSLQESMDVYRILEETAISMLNENGFDFECGHGLVNAKKAIDKVLGRRRAEKPYCDYATRKNEIFLLFGCIA